MPLKLIPPAQAPGRRSYYVRGTYLGVAVFRSARTDRRALAAAELRRIESEIERGRYAQPAAPAPPSFADAALGYLKDCPAAEVGLVERLLRHFQTTPLAAITKDAIDRAEAALYPGGRAKFAAGTFNRMVRAPIAAVLHHAAKRGLMGWIRVEKYAEQSRTRWLEPDQAGALIAAADAVDRVKERHRDARLAPLLAFLFTSGARVSEACKLTWADVDLKRRHVILRDTKNGETYGVHLSELAFQAIANLPHQRHPERKVFGFRDRHAVKYSLAKARKAAGVPDFTLHQARHSFATWLRRNGEDWKKIMELGRWKDLKSVMRYQHVASDELKEAIDGLPLRKVDRG